jgi:hypothetical protein
MTKPQPTCHDCYFRRHALCALTVKQPCPTFRAASHVLEPPRQPQLLARPAGIGVAQAYS